MICMAHDTTRFGGLSGGQMATILGVAPTKVNQAAESALDKMAIWFGTDTQSALRAIADRLRTPTQGMCEILRRRETAAADAVAQKRQEGDERFTELLTQANELKIPARDLTEAMKVL